MENVKSCSLAELENMEQETYQLLDIRSMEAFDHGHLKDALNIPANELIERKDELQTEKKIVHFFIDCMKRHFNLLIRTIFGNYFYMLKKIIIFVVIITYIILKKE